MCYIKSIKNISKHWQQIYRNAVCPWPLGWLWHVKIFLHTSFSHLASYPRWKLPYGEEMVKQLSFSADCSHQMRPCQGDTRGIRLHHRREPNYKISLEIMYIPSGWKITFTICIHLYLWYSVPSQEFPPKVGIKAEMSLAFSVQALPLSILNPLPASSFSLVLIHWWSNSPEVSPWRTPLQPCPHTVS